MRIEGTDSRYTSNITFGKIERGIDEMNAQAPKQDTAVDVKISKEGFQSYHNSIMTAEQGKLGNSGVILTDYRSMIGSKLPSTYGEKDENGEYERIYQSISDKADSLLKAYAEVYDEIQRGYQDGTRETYIEDKDSETGYRKLTKDEELAELEKAYEDHVNWFASKNNKNIITALEAHTKKVQALSSGRAKFAGEASQELEKRKAELDQLPENLGRTMMDAANIFKVQYGKGDISTLLSGIKVFAELK